MLTQPILIAASLLLATSSVFTSSSTPSTGITLNQPVIASSTPTFVPSNSTTDTTSLASTTTDIVNTAPAPIDYTGLIPGISNVAATPTATSTTITWDTSDQVSDSVVAYGTSANNYTATSTGAALSLNHVVTLQDLLPGTTYHYQVSSTNGFGTVTSIDQTFTTPGLAPGQDTAAPVQSNLIVIPPETSLDTTALVSWTTDQPTSGTVLYGPATSYGSAVTEDQDANSASRMFGEDHVFLLTGLLPGMTYHFKVVSQNAAGAWSASADQVLQFYP